MGGIAIMAWSAANMFLLYLILCRLKLHRVHRSSEKIGKTYVTFLQITICVSSLSSFCLLLYCISFRSRCIGA